MGGEAMGGGAIEDGATTGGGAIAGGAATDGMPNWDVGNCGAPVAGSYAGGWWGWGYEATAVCAGYDGAPVYGGGA